MADDGDVASSGHCIRNDVNQAVYKGSTGSQSAPTMSSITNYLVTRDQYDGVNPSKQPEGFNSSRKIVHTIHPVHGSADSGLLQRLERLGRSNHRGDGGIWAARHDNHIHVQHGCTWATGRCKCTTVIGAFGPKLRASKQYTIEPSHFGDGEKRAMWKHLDQGQGLRKWIFLQNSCGESYDLCGDINFHPDQQPNGDSEEGDQFQGKFACSAIQGPGGLPEDGGNEEHSLHAENQPPAKRQKTTLFEVAEAAFQLSTREWCTDMEYILGHPGMHKDGRFQYLITMKRLDVEKALASLLAVEYQRIRHMTLDQIRAKFNTTESPSFGLNKVQGREISFDALKSWFEVQSGNGEEGGAMLVHKFQQWFDSNLGKKNTMLLIGPPSCGKTWVSQAFQRIGRWYGGILAWTRAGSAFTFQETVTARIIYHDECRQPSADVGYLETLKQIYAGTQVNVDKKFKSNSMSSGAPVIATCNAYPVTNAEERNAFEERWTVINCQVVEGLKEPCSLPCHPFAIFDLIDWAKNVLNPITDNTIIEH